MHEPGDERAPLPPPVAPALVFALSGLGKSTLCARYPDVCHDTDTTFDAALAACFPALTGRRERRIAWRALARARPWERPETPAFRQWATTRCALVGGIVAALRAPGPRLVLTNMLLVPWPYARYYGVTLGGYGSHWAALSRVADNAQDEAANAHLEGFAPRVRLPPGCFVSDEPELIAWLEGARRFRSGEAPLREREDGEGGR
ncbi:MAG: hypothetical protein H6703_07555 [Myxococcales bacterium]|nr:hypothetical protein [Myxococcales bacterium]